MFRFVLFENNYNYNKLTTHKNEAVLKINYPNNNSIKILTVHKK